MLQLTMSNYANPVADQWYRCLNPHQRLFMKESFKVVTGVAWEDAGFMLNMRERIAIFHGKLVAEGVIKPCGYSKR